MSRYGSWLVARGSWLVAGGWAAIGSLLWLSLGYTAIGYQGGYRRTLSVGAIGSAGDRLRLSAGLEQHSKQPGADDFGVSPHAMWQ
jgi:hypothetical protein